MSGDAGTPIPPPSPGNNSVNSGLTAASGSYSVQSGSVVSAGNAAAAAPAPPQTPSQTGTPLRNSSGSAGAGQQQQQQQQQLFTAATAPAWPNLSGSGGGGNGGGNVPSSPIGRTGTAAAMTVPGTPLPPTTPLVAAASPGGAGAGASASASAAYASPGPAPAGTTTPLRVVAPNTTTAAAAGGGGGVSSPPPTPGNASAQQQQSQQQSQQPAIGLPPPTPVQPHPGAPPPLVPSLSTQTSASAASASSNADLQQAQATSVALGVEALERQQALVEQRRASAASQAAVVRQRQAQQQFQAQQQAQQAQFQVQQQHQQAQQQQHMTQQQLQQQRHPQAPPPIGGMPPSYPVPRYPTGAGAGTGTDDDTVPSSVSGGGGGGAVPSASASASSSSAVRRSGSFAKLLTPLKRLSSHGPDGKEAKTPSSAAGTEIMSPPPGQRQRQRNPAGDDDDDNDDDPEEGMWADHEVKPLVYGYLQKLGRNGQWQKRFFETDGECLTYYKSRKRTKLLASLDLLKVGGIRCDDEDPEGCVFAIQVSDRPYYLRAETKAACKDWVINLNRVREARLEIGGIQLVQPHFSHEYNEIEVVDGGGGGSAGAGGGDRNRSESDEYAARVVMIANRTRTRAIATTETEESLKKMILNQRASSSVVDVGGVSDLLNAPPSPGKVGTEGGLMTAPHSPGGRVLADHLPPVVLARWQKRRTNLQRLRYRLTQWARKINVMACTVIPHHDVSHEYTPDTANFAADRVSGTGAVVRGTAKLSDIDEHSREQELNQVDSAISGESGDYEEQETRELS